MAASRISSCFYTSEPFSGRAATRKIRSVDVPSRARALYEAENRITNGRRTRARGKEAGWERGGEKERDFEPRQLITLNYTSYTLDRARSTRAIKADSHLPARSAARSEQTGKSCIAKNQKRCNYSGHEIMRSEESGKWSDLFVIRTRDEIKSEISRYGASTCQCDTRIYIYIFIYLHLYMLARHMYTRHARRVYLIT